MVRGPSRWMVATASLIQFSLNRSSPSSVAMYSPRAWPMAWLRLSDRSDTWMRCSTSPSRNAGWVVTACSVSASPPSSVITSSIFSPRASACRRMRSMEASVAVTRPRSRWKVTTALTRPGTPGTDSGMVTTLDPDDVALVHVHHHVAQVVDDLLVVRGEHQDAGAVDQFGQALFGLLHERIVAHAHPLVHQQDLRLDAGDDREGQAQYHAAGIGAHGHAHVVAQARELDHAR